MRVANADLADSLVDSSRNDFAALALAASLSEMSSADRFFPPVEAGSAPNGVLLTLPETGRMRGVTG